MIERRVQPFLPDFLPASKRCVRILPAKKICACDGVQQFLRGMRRRLHADRGCLRCTQLCAYIAVTTVDYPQATIFSGLSALRATLEALHTGGEVDLETCKAKGLNHKLHKVMNEFKVK